MRPTIVCPTISVLLAASLIVLVGRAPVARAQTTFGWDGGGGNVLWGTSANWLPNGVPNFQDNIILAGTSLAGPQTIDLNGTRRINRIEANGVGGGTYTFANSGAGALEIFLAGGNAIFTDGGSAVQVDADVLFEASNVGLRFNVGPTGGQIVVNGDVRPSDFATGALTLELTSRNLGLNPSVQVGGVIADGPLASLGVTTGFNDAANEHRGVISLTGLNTYTGPTRVIAATLEFDSIGNVGSGASALGAPATAGNGTILIGAASKTGVLRYVGTDPGGHSTDRAIGIAGSSSGAIIDASGVGPLVLTSGTQTDSSTTTRTLTLAGSNTGSNTFSGPIAAANGSGVLNLVKSGAGRWVLTAPNTYDGSTTVNAGELVLQGPSAAIGVAIVAALNINAGGTFTLDGGTVDANDLNNTGTFNFRSGVLELVSGNTTTGGGSFVIGTDGVGRLLLTGGSNNFGNITLNDSDDDFIITAGGTFAFSSIDNSAGGDFSSINANLQINGGQITTTHGEIRSRIIGTGGLTKVGPGTLVLSYTGVASNHTGPTIISGGILRPVSNQTADQMSDLSSVTIAAGATLDLTQSNDGEEIGALSGMGTVLTDPLENLAVDTGSASATFGGNISGGGAFFKRGTGTQTLTGDNTYFGATAIDPNGGTLEVAAGGSIVGTSRIDYSTSATLSVTGGTIDTPGIIRPGANSATLSLTAGLIKANQIDRSFGTQYLDTFTWTGGTVHLLSATRIGGPLGAIADRPFDNSLTLTAAKTLIVDSSLSVQSGGTLNISGGTVIADTIATGGTVSFNFGTMRMRNNQTFDAARLAALDTDTPFDAARTLIVDGSVTVNAPFTLAGGTFSAGQLVNPQNLILSSGTLNVTNGDLAIAAATAVDAATGMTINVTAGGLNNAGQFNAVGSVAEFAAASTNDAGAQINAINSTLEFDGGLTNDGELNLINTTVNGAVLNSGATATAGTATFSGDVSGAGNFTGGGEVVFQGSYAPGDSPAAVAFEGDLTLADTNTLFVEIGGTTPGSQYDTLTVAGTAALDGILDVALIDDFTPTAGQQFTILSANSITNNGLVLGGAAAGSFSLLVGSTSVMLQATAPSLPGDYNQDGSVDAADYVVWRKNDINGQQGYDTWRANFGATAGSGSASSSNAAVPEPDLLAFVLTFACAIIVARPRSKGYRK